MWPATEYSKFFDEIQSISNDFRFWDKKYLELQKDSNNNVQDYFKVYLFIPFLD